MSAPATIDVRKVRHRTSVILDTGAEVFLTPVGPTDASLVMGRNREEVDGSFAQKLTLKLLDADIPGYGLASQVVALNTKIHSVVSYDEGATWDDDDPFLGSVLEWTPDDDARTFDVVAYDDLAWLYADAADVTAFYESGTPGTRVIADLFAGFGIAVARIDGPDTPMPKLVFTGKAGEFLTAVLQHALAVGGKCYLPRVRKGTVEVVLPGDNDPVYVFDGRTNVLKTKEEQTLKDAANEVAATGMTTELDDPLRGTVTGAASEGDASAVEQRQGIVRKVTVRSSTLDTAAKAQGAAVVAMSKASGPVVLRSFTSADAPPLHKGDIVREFAGRADGYFTVYTLSHDEDAMTMDVALIARGTALYKAQRFEDRKKALAGGGGKCSADGLFAWCRAHLGKPYVWGGDGDPGYDCSGFTQAAYKETCGVDIGGWTGEQLDKNPTGDGSPGDLVFFNHTAMVDGAWTDHVGIVGPDAGMMFHYGSPGQYGPIASIGKPVWQYRRPVDFAAEALKADAGGATGAVLSRAPADLQAAIQRYFPSDAWEAAASVSECETDGWRNFHNTTYPDDSHGYFQINMLAHGGSVAYWMDADNNVRKAAQLWRAAGNSFARDWVNCSRRLGLR